MCQQQQQTGMRSLSCLLPAVCRQMVSTSRCCHPQQQQVLRLLPSQLQQRQQQRS
jgi:hypothetical protein